MSVRPSSPHADPKAAEAPRITFREPVSGDGFVDAAWWPRTTSLEQELPGLFELLWQADHKVDRISYSMSAWHQAPRRLVIDGRTVRLGGFTVGDPLMASVSDPWGKEHIDVLVIAPDTAPDVAARAMEIAGRSDHGDHADAILARAATASTS